MDMAGVTRHPRFCGRGHMGLLAGRGRIQETGDGEAREALVKPGPGIFDVVEAYGGKGARHYAERWAKLYLSCFPDD